MFAFVRPFVAGVTLAVVFFAAPSCAAGQSTPPAPSPQGQTSRQPNSDYGPGGHAVIQQNPAQDTLQGIVSETPRGQAPQHNAASDELSGTVINIYDPKNVLRRREIDFSIPPAGQKIETYGVLLDDKGHPSANVEFKYDLHGGLSYSDYTHFGLHGERTAEEVTNYRADGYEIKDWSLGTHQWYSSFNAYKTPAQAPPPPSSTNIGVLFPRSYLPGETVTGSLWPSSYAENFKSVPGLSEYSFPIQLYHLPDGAPEWSSLEIGVKNDGYVPVNPNGTFSLHIPYDWKGPLQLQARQPNPVAGAGPTGAQLNIDPPVAAPTLTSDQFPAQGMKLLNDYAENHLVKLWEDANDLEETLDELQDDPNPDWARIYAVEDELDDVYDDIDDAEDEMPPAEVTALAQSLLQEADSFHDWLEKQPSLSTDDRAELLDSTSWANFLDNEIGYNKYLADNEPTERITQPFWTNPVMPQGKLDEIGGSFPLDPYDTHIRIDNTLITPLAATPNNWYFMPPPNLTAGQHNLYIDSPLYPETIFPVFSMTLTMSADNLHLLKNQSTTWHLTLDGLNGLPGGAWSGSSDPTDLVGSAELSAAQKAAGSSRTGYIMLSVTNASPATISMQDQLRMLNASFFAPSGSYKLDGGVRAIQTGSFSILGVARAYLDPEIGIGNPPSTTPPGGSSGPSPGTPGTSWFPPFQMSYDPAAFSNSSFMTSCPGSGAPPPIAPTPTGGKPATTPCVDSVISDLTPPQTKPQPNGVKDKIEEATKRYQDAIMQQQVAYHDLAEAEERVENEFNNGLTRVPDAVRADFKNAQDNLTKATEAKQKAAAAQKAAPGEANAHALAVAEENYAPAHAGYQAARQKVIDNFDAAEKAAYERAEDNRRKAAAALNAADNEVRESREALSDLQAPPDEVM